MLWLSCYFQAFVAFVKMQQEELERQRQKEEEERRRRREDMKRRKRMLEAAFDGDEEEIKAVLKEVGNGWNEIIAWMSNYMLSFLWYVLTHPCPNCNDGLAKLLLKLGHELLIVSTLLCGSGNLSMPKT